MGKFLFCGGGFEWWSSLFKKESFYSMELLWNFFSQIFKIFLNADKLLEEQWCKIECKMNSFYSIGNPVHFLK